MNMADIRPTTITPALLALLANAGLPTTDLRERPDLRLFATAIGGEPAGCVALEVHDDIGLLRSLAVDPALRGTGLGAGLLRYAEEQARQAGVDTLYLLTTTAAAFFERNGYQRAKRSEAPPAIAATTQFSGLCPASSDFMRKDLPPL